MGLQDFEVVCKLGLGAYGSVYKAVRRVDGRTYAIKRVKLEGLEQQDLAMTLNEIRLLASFRHPRIVRLHETFLDGGSATSTGDTTSTTSPPMPLHLCVVMEYCGFQDLERKIRRYRARGERVDERVVWVYLVQTLEALAALHSLKILHRDIKPANILLDEEGNAKLGDLNVSKCVDDATGEVQTVVGTLPYMAPELWRGEAYAFQADLWALGCTLFELAALAPPFDGASALQLQRAVLKRRFQTAIPEDSYSQELRDVILQIMLHPDPAERLTAEALLAHPAVASRLYLVRHQLPPDLPPPTPLTPCAPIDTATVTLAELPTLLPALLPGPSYLPPPPANEAATTEDAPSPSPSPCPSPPPPLAAPEAAAAGAGAAGAADLSPGSQTKKKQRHRQRKHKQHQQQKQQLVQEALLLRGGSEMDAAAVSAVSAALGGPPGLTGGSPSSLRALLQSPYPDTADSPASPLAPAAPAPAPAIVSPGGLAAAPGAGEAATAPIPALATATPPDQPSPQPQPQPSQEEPPQQQQLLRRTRRPPSLPTARLTGLLNASTLDEKEPAAGTGDGSSMAPAVAVAVAAVTSAPTDESHEGGVWERVPTPTSFAVPLPSPSPASPYQLPPGLAAALAASPSLSTAGAVAPGGGSGVSGPGPQGMEEGAAAAAMPGVIGAEEGK